VDHSLYREIGELRGIQVGGKGGRPQVIVTQPVTVTTVDPTETSSTTKLDHEVREDTTDGAGEAKAITDPEQATPTAASRKRSHISPPSSAEQDKPMKKRPKHDQAEQEEDEEDEEEGSIEHQPLIIRVPRAVIDKAHKGRSSAPRVAWSPVNVNEIILAFASPDVAQRAQRSSWSPTSAAAFMNRYQYPLVAFVQGLWCDEKDTERARAANKAALIGDAILRLQTIKRIDKLADRTPEQEQELLDTLLARDFHSTFLYRKYKTTDPSIASSSHKHQLSSQIEHAFVFIGLPKLVRISPTTFFVALHITHVIARR
jgi:hypothetical protein